VVLRLIVNTPLFEATSQPLVPQLAAELSDLRVAPATGGKAQATVVEAQCLQRRLAVGQAAAATPSRGSRSPSPGLPAAARNYIGFALHLHRRIEHGAQFAGGWWRSNCVIAARLLSIWRCWCQAHRFSPTTCSTASVIRP